MYYVMKAVRAALLDRKVFEDVTDDQESIRIALGIVILAAISFGIAVWMLTPGDLVQEGLPSILSGLGAKNLGLLIGATSVPLTWVAWSVIAYYVGTRLMRGNASYRVTLRAVGLAYSPGILFVLMAVPLVSQQAGLLPFWFLGTVTMAVKGTQKFNWLMTALPVLMGWLFFMFVRAFVLAQAAVPLASQAAPS